LIYLTIVAFLSLLPPNDLPDIPLFPGADKIVHTCMYLGLAWLACWSMHAEVKRKWYYIIILFSISWGIMMEIFQFLMHLGRAFEFYDIVSNSIGTLIGVLIYILMAQQKRKVDRSTN
jgi:VanZ family protein